MCITIITMNVKINERVTLPVVMRYKWVLDGAYRIKVFLVAITIPRRVNILCLDEVGVCTETTSVRVHPVQMVVRRNLIRV